MKQKTSKHIVMPLIGGGEGDDYVESILKGKKGIYKNLRFYFNEAIKKDKIKKDDYSLKNFKLYRDYLDSGSNDRTRTSQTRNLMADIMNNQVDLIIKEAEKKEKNENKKVNEETEKLKKEMEKLENEKKSKQVIANVLKNQKNKSKLKKLINETKAKKQSQQLIKNDDSDEEPIDIPKTNDLTNLELLIYYNNLLNEFKDVYDNSIDDFNEFDKLITYYEKENDVDNKKDIADKIIEIDFDIDEKIKQMDDLLTEVDNNIDSITKELINDVDLILLNKAFSENAAKSESVPDEAIGFVDYFSDIIKMPDAEKLGEKKKYKKYLNFIKDILQNFRKDFYEPIKTNFKLLVSEFKKRRNDMVQYRNENNNDNKKPKLEPEKKLTNEELKTIKETLPKEDLIKVIIRRHPNLKKEDLNSMSVEDLIQISHQLGVNLLDLNILKVPKNATKEEKELIENLENIRRQREIEAEFRKLKSQIDNDEVRSEKERTDNNLKIASKSLIKKPTYNPDAVSTKKMEKKKPKDEKKIEKAVAKILKDDTPVIKLNEEQIQGMGKVKKSNPYLEFVKDFRKKNAGMYDNKEMIRQASYA
eukprot:gene12649-6551_t